MRTGRGGNMQKLNFLDFAQIVSSRFDMKATAFPNSLGIKFIKIPHNADLISFALQHGTENTIFYKELEKESKNYFLRINFENYMKDPRPGNFILFNDMEWFYFDVHRDTMKTYMLSKHQITTPQKLQRFVQNMQVTKKTVACCVCMEEKPRNRVRCCGKCLATLCNDCTSKWEKQRGLQYNCPTCRNQGKLVRLVNI